MTLIDNTVLGLSVAFGIGLLIGIERERGAHAAGTQYAAGVRTFTLTALLGAVSVLIGGEIAVIAFGLVIGVLVALGYKVTRTQDPGLTTEVAQIGAFLLGALAMQRPQLAAGLGVVVAILLASRSQLHHWVKNVLTDVEIRDGLLLAAAALVILPLTPNAPIDPWGVVNPRVLWALAVTVMAINGLGYISLRVAGGRVGLVLAGLFSGFVSSTATIAAMATRARGQPELRQPAVAGATIAGVSSLVELAIVIGVVNITLLRALALPLAAAALVAVVCAGLFALHRSREHIDPRTLQGRPFDPKAAMIFVAVIGLTLIASALLTQWLGHSGLVLASSVSGLGDIHASAISVASLSARNEVSEHISTLAVLAGLTTNAVSKTFLAFSLGRRAFGMQMIPGIWLPVAAAWLVLSAHQFLS